ncbi:MAG: GYD domain-containing protein [Desulfomonilaceae bacterium]
MRTYVVLCNWTQKGIEKVKDSPARLDEAKKAFQAMGAEIKAFYLVMGRYDMVIVAEAPDDETAAKLALAVGSRGGIRTESLRAYPEDEYRKLLAALP